MGVSVRVSRNVRVGLPWWAAIPAILIYAAVWLVLAAGWVVVWLTAAAIDAYRAHAEGKH